jgi:hypothetical protein
VLVQDNAFAALQKHHIHELLNSVTRSPDGRVAVNRFAVDRVWLVRNTRLWKLYTLHRDHVATVAHTSQLHDAGGRKPSIATAQNTWVQNTLNLRTDVNEHLLFHGCRSVNRAKIIIEQGFDERIANLSGFLGELFMIWFCMYRKRSQFFSVLYCYVLMATLRICYNDHVQQHFT